MIIYRTMKPDDIAAGLSLCRAAGWNQVARDWQTILHLSPNTCIVAVKDDKVIGTVTTICYQKFFSWIGMVLVDPAFQGIGVGSNLLKEALQILQNEETIKLDATPAGQKVYTKFYFTEEYSFSRMVAIAPIERLKEHIAQPLQKNYLLALEKYDREIFGADRQILLQRMFEGAPQFAFLSEVKNKIQGYCMGRKGHNFIHIGPVIAENAHIAKNLISAALINCICRPVILDVLPFNPEWMAWLKSIGFAEQRHLTRMYRGRNSFAGVPEKQFAILGPEFG